MGWVGMGAGGGGLRVGVGLEVSGRVFGVSRGISLLSNAYRERIPKKVKR